ncbi:MAG: phosphoribosyl-AMP cyclohydrolase [Candidatus Accumulibacter appositus]|uniref:Phosphoribosyl-AMP cyclohydrolase n=1 Tax=Candidatus Accumulibacter appositus TaxID=1454003 RepID=A0A011PLX7_9PROT|nr:phosphoribosyl-AMP cyclohydrolase [Accumulibacter sp.]EXI77855.1 MAG: phosphoribosyl-AMP cyclohydrolase [Candidatus Accumulibacter appositus]HRF05760.1 phosphoribosyl-AMP cyclohydrolase [Accumulibacter sp.]
MSDLDPGQDWLDALKWDEQGMLPAIAQDADSGRVLMFAFMNRQSLQETVNSGSAVYWSRSRKRLWRKGEESGHAQRVRSIRTDCDGDVLLLAIDQEGGIACHTGRESCFFYQLRGKMWVAVDPVLKDPKEIYGK